MVLEEVKKLLESRKSNMVVTNQNVSSLTILGVALIVLKAANLTTWSWWWILAPFWIPFVISVLLSLVIVGTGIYLYYKLRTLDVTTEETKETNTEKEEKPKKSKSRKSKAKKDGENSNTGIEGKNE